MTEEEILGIRNQIIDATNKEDIRKILPSYKRSSFKRDMQRLLNFLNEDKEAMLELNMEGSSEKLDIDSLKEKIDFCQNYFNEYDALKEERYSDKIILAITDNGKIPFKEDLENIDYSEHKAVKKALDRLKDSFVCDGNHIKDMVHFSNVYRSSGNKQIRVFFRMLPDNYVYIIGIMQKKRNWGKEEADFINKRIQLLDGPMKKVVSSLTKDNFKEELLNESNKLLNDIFTSKKKEKSPVKKKEVFIEQKWLDFYDKVLNHYKKYHNINMKIEGCVNWLKQQRSLYHLNLLNEKQVELLEELAIDWNFGITKNTIERYLKLNTKKDNKPLKQEVKQPIADDWYLYYFLVIEYQQLSGFKEVELRTVYKDKKIGYWLQKQRKAYWNNELEETKIGLLNKIGIDWTYALTKNTIALSKRYLENNIKEAKLKEEATVVTPMHKENLETNTSVTSKKAYEASVISEPIEQLSFNEKETEEEKLQIIENLNALMIKMPYDKLKKFEERLKNSSELEENVGDITEKMYELAEKDKLDAFILQLENDNEGLSDISTRHR